MLRRRGLFQLTAARVGTTVYAFEPSAASAGFLVHADVRHAESMIDLALAAALSQSSDVCLCRLDDPRPELVGLSFGLNQLWRFVGLS